MTNREKLIKLATDKITSMDKYDLADFLSDNNGILKCIKCPFWDYCVKHEDEDARNQCYVTLISLLEEDGE